MPGKGYRRDFGVPLPVPPEFPQDLDFKWFRWLARAMHWDLRVRVRFE
ncbi:MAG: hypothetical protein HYW28_10260 [Rhodospirillales bacterium]|nr:hypothetical protein [Rhodospirillales bacterium]